LEGINIEVREKFVCPKCESLASIDSVIDDWHGNTYDQLVCSECGYVKKLRDMEEPEKVVCPFLDYCESAGRRCFTCKNNHRRDYYEAE